MDKITKYALLVNGISILAGCIGSIILIFTPFSKDIVSYILGVCAGLVSFSIFLTSARSMQREAMKLKEGEKPSKHYILYLILALIFTGFFFFLMYYFEFVAKKEGYNIIVALCGFLQDKVCQFVLAFTYARKVIFGG